MIASACVHLPRLWWTNCYENYKQSRQQLKKQKQKKKKKTKISIQHTKHLVLFYLGKKNNIKIVEKLGKSFVKFRFTRIYRCRRFVHMRFALHRLQPITKFLHGLAMHNGVTQRQRNNNKSLNDWPWNMRAVSMPPNMHYL